MGVYDLWAMADKAVVAAIVDDLVGARYCIAHHSPSRAENIRNEDEVIRLYFEAMADTESYAILEKELED